MAVVEYRVENHIAFVTLNRPEARNALNPEVAVRLSRIWEQVRDDDNVRVAVVTGTGTTFCAGADLGQLLPLLTRSRGAQDEWDQHIVDDQGHVFRAVLRDFDTEKPVVAAVNGHAIAGGMELVQGTDIRVSAAGAKFGVQEVKWAIAPAGGSTVRLPNQLPYATAMELLLTGDLIDAETARGYGFLNHVVADDEVLPKAVEIAQKIAANGPIAVRAIRAAARACLGHPELDALALENEYLDPVFRTEDAKEGPRAFMEKRTPVYRGV